MKDKKILYLGAGKMAHALVSGRKTKTFRHYFYSPSGISAQKLAQEFSGEVVSNLTSLHDFHLIVIACKPQQWPQLLTQLQESSLNKDSLVISLMAGISLEKLSLSLGNPLLRLMPNTPSSIGEGIGLVLKSPSVNNELETLMKEYFSESLLLYECQSEKQFNDLTVLFGSGPGYLFYFLEAFSHWAQAQDVSEKDANQLVLKLFSGSTALAKTSPKAFGELKENVCSKGGITIEAIKILEKKFPPLLEEALSRAKARGEELNS